jgi:hypothetical protein
MTNTYKVSIAKHKPQTFEIWLENVNGLRIVRMGVGDKEPARSHSCINWLTSLKIASLMSRLSWKILFTIQ